MSALIGGLAEFILSRTVGDISHVTIEAEDRDPTILIVDRRPCCWSVIERGRTRQRARLAEAATWVPLIETVPGVVAVSPQIGGAGFLTRGAQVAQVSVTGLEPGRESAILEPRRLHGRGVGAAWVGHDRAGPAAGRRPVPVGWARPLRLQCSGGVAAVLTLGGILRYRQRHAWTPARAFVSLSTARTLFAMPQGVTRIEIRLSDLNAADATALRIRALTGLDAVPWTDGAEQLMEALDAQAQTGYFLKSFALITIVIGVASALLLSTYRRRPEIGIMRAMGAGRGFVIFVFVTQGALIGLMGGLHRRGAGISGAAALSLARCLRGRAPCRWTSRKAPTGWPSR